MKFLSTRHTLKRILTATAVSAVLAGGAHAANTLTEAGTSVSNTFTLDYEVGAVGQPTITNDSVSPPVGAVVQGTPTLFTVDRKVDLIITATNSTLTSPPGTNVTLTYELENEGNDNQAYSFSLDDLDNGAGSFDATIVSITYYIDTDDDADFSDETGVVIAQTVIGNDPDTDPVAVTGDVPKGVRVLVEVLTTLAGGIVDTETDGITLVAEARNPTAWGIEAVAVGEEAEVTLATGGANTLTGNAENVLADDTGVLAAENTGDADGLYAVTGLIEIQSPDLAASKTISVISEASAGCSTATVVANAKSIPGACIEYLIEVENTGVTATAENLVIQDILPDEVTFISASLATTTTTGFADDPAVAGVGPTLVAPASSTACDGTAGTCDITVNDAVLAAGEIGQILIRALVD